MLPLFQAPRPLSSFPLRHSNLLLRVPERIWKARLPSVLEGHGSPCGCWAGRWGWVRGSCSSGGWKTPRRPGPRRGQLLTPTRLVAGLRGRWVENGVKSSSGSGGQATVTPSSHRRPDVGPGARPGPKRAGREDPCRRGEAVLENPVLDQFSGLFHPLRGRRQVGHGREETRVPVGVTGAPEAAATLTLLSSPSRTGWGRPAPVPNTQ